MNLRQFLGACQSNNIMLKVIDVNKEATVYEGGFTHFATDVKEGEFYEPAYVVFFAIEDNTLIIKIRLY